MAVYKVPQDVEADDKLLGPFTFRQFIYLIILSGLLAITWVMAKLFLPLILIPLPAILLFGTLALPLKKDQPMETYLAAVVSFYLKPRKRFWMPGQRETTIKITAPKIVERSRTRNLTGDEASHRLSFLAKVVDSAGYSILDQSNLRQEFVAEARATSDIFDRGTSPLINQMLAREDRERHAELVDQMRTALAYNDQITARSRGTATISRYSELGGIATPAIRQTLSSQPSIISQNPNFVNLAHNSDYSIQTISSEANRLSQAGNQ